MSFYVRCPTCFRILTENKAVQEEEREAILTDPQLDEEQKNLKLAEWLDRHGHKRFCCRMRVRCEIPLHQILE